MDPILPPYKPRWLIRKMITECVERTSKPKKYPKPPRVDRGPRGGPSSERLFTLATQLERKRYIHPLKDKYSAAYRDKHPVREGALSYVATSRIVELSEPKYKYTHPAPKPLVKKEALQYEASPRIEEIAQPKYLRRKWKKKRPVFVKKGALNAKASKRVIQLAIAKKREDNCCQEYGIVKPEALKAFASKRIKLLAKPKPLITEVKEHPINPKYRKNKPEEEKEDEE